MQNMVLTSCLALRYDPSHKPSQSEIFLILLTLKLILLQVRTHFARPKWTEVFKRIALKHPYSTVGKEFLQSQV